MDIFSIECFIAVAETKSFTRAAERVGRTQSAITQQISNLEKNLATKLFLREKGIRLTVEGEVFLTYGLKMHQLAQEMVDRFKEPQLKGEVRLGIPEDFATLFLTDVLEDFTRSHPRITLNVECDLTLNLFDKFKQGKLDIVLVKMSSPRDFPYGVEIWSEPLVWVGKANSSRLFKGVSPLPLILSPTPCVYRSVALQSLLAKDISTKVVFTSPSYTGIIAATRANLGLTVLPSTLIPEGLEVVQDASLPPLPELHVSLLTKDDKDIPIVFLKNHLLKRLQQQKKISGLIS